MNSPSVLALVVVEDVLVAVLGHDEAPLTCGFVRCLAFLAGRMPRMPVVGGEVFAGYTVVRLLGSGGMGEVYLARHPRLPRHDALKILPASVSGDAEFRERFNRAVLFARSLHCSCEGCTRSCVVQVKVARRCRDWLGLRPRLLIYDGVSSRGGSTP
jgi:hypothetical protein